MFLSNETGNTRAKKSRDHFLATKKVFFCFQGSNDVTEREKIGAIKGNNILLRRSIPGSDVPLGNLENSGTGKRT